MFDGLPRAITFVLRGFRFSVTRFITPLFRQHLFLQKRRILSSMTYPILKFSQLNLAVHGFLVSFALKAFLVGVMIRDNLILLPFLSDLEDHVVRVFKNSDTAPSNTF